MTYRVTDRTPAARRFAFAPGRVVGLYRVALRVAGRAMGSLSAEGSAALAQAASEEVQPFLAPWGVSLEGAAVTVTPADSSDRGEFERQAAEARRFLQSRRGRRARRAMRLASSEAAH